MFTRWLSLCAIIESGSLFGGYAPAALLPGRLAEMGRAFHQLGLPLVPR